MNCKICKKQLTKKTKSGTCSRKCNATYQNKLKADNFTPNKCKNCDKPCRRVSRAKFCSIKCQSEFNSGKNHYAWKGGTTITSEGYVSLLIKDHPFADSANKILEHRYIVEDFLKSTNPNSKFLKNNYLQRTVIIHHINGNKSDNRLSNLYVCENQSEHQDIHRNKHIIKSNILDADSGN